MLCVPKNGSGGGVRGRLGPLSELTRISYGMGYDILAVKQSRVGGLDNGARIAVPGHPLYTTFGEGYCCRERSNQMFVRMRSNE